jgi:hypothetical protein
MPKLIVNDHYNNSSQNKHSKKNIYALMIKSEIINIWNESVCLIPQGGTHMRDRQSQLLSHLNNQRKYLSSDSDIEQLFLIKFLRY